MIRRASGQTTMTRVGVAVVAVTDGTAECFRPGHHEGGGSMPQPDIRWLPRVGDAAHVKGTEIVGTVTRTNGVASPRFRLEVLPPAAGGDLRARRLVAAAARRASRWYGLGELEPPA